MAITEADRPFLSRAIALAERALEQGDEPSVDHLSPAERGQCVVYTSGEHCPMCAAAHGWVGLGRIVYAASSAQLQEWAAELGLPASPVAALPLQTVVPGLEVDGPDPDLSEQVRRLHARRKDRAPRG